MDTKDILSLLLVRDIFTDDTTLGKLYINGKYFCYTLENALRYKGLKIKDKTAIASGIYKIIINKSTRFNREMPLILDVPLFSGIRIHGGNTQKDTSGCIITAYNKINDKFIQGTAERDITSLIKQQNKEVYIVIENRLNL